MLLFSPVGGGNAAMRRVSGSAMEDAPVTNTETKAALSFRIYIMTVNYRNIYF